MFVSFVHNLFKELLVLITILPENFQFIVIQTVQFGKCFFF